MQSLDPVGHELVVEEASTPTGVFEVQQRRKEVMARYEARLEYLRARLKGAELHEKLLRK
jgi:ABC-type Fe3+-hydroxamate transport system substrate-binding protein